MMRSTRHTRRLNIAPHDIRKQCRHGDDREQGEPKLLKGSKHGQLSELIQSMSRDAGVDWIAVSPVRRLSSGTSHAVATQTKNTP